MISFYMPSNDPVVLQKVSLMKHIQMEKYHAIYDKHAAVLFLNVDSVRVREMTNKKQHQSYVTTLTMQAQLKEN